LPCIVKANNGGALNIWLRAEWRESADRSALWQIGLQFKGDGPADA
jgi:hypothetical protein